MPGKLFDSTELDADGRQLVLSDGITHVRYFDNSLETWDKVGSAGQSWHTEVFSPNDAFDESTINTSRWSLQGPSTRTLEHSNGSLVLGIEKDEGTVSLSSDGKWRLSGDFDVRLYIDWASYYNEYRSLTHTFLKVGYDDSNAARISFTFNGIDGYRFTPEKTVARNIRFFDWKSNGSPMELSNFSGATSWDYLKITRTSGVVRMYISDGDTTTQVGDDVSDAVFTEDLFIDFGIESKEFNTYRQNFTKFYVVAGTINPAVEFFSTNRGRRQDFPIRVIAVVDNQSLSLVDEDNSTLWMRFEVGDLALLPTTDIRVAMCEGTLYCATSGGLIAFDFVQDKIFKYTDDEIQVADEGIALRNAGVTFRTYLTPAGTMADNNTHDIACRRVGSEVYIAITHDSGVTVRRALAEGVSNSSDGPTPGSIVSISEKGALFWAGYDSPNDVGEVSYYSNVTALAITGTTTFSRSGYYGTATSQPTLGEVVTSFDVRTVEGFDQLVVASTDGIAFIGQNPVRSSTYGTEAPSANPFSDPTFENYMGLDWRVNYNSFIRIGNALRSTTPTWLTDTYTALIYFSDLEFRANLIAGSSMGIYQEVDLTGVERVYFDIEVVGGFPKVWDFEVLVDDNVVKSYSSEDSFTKLNDSVVVLGYDGLRRVEFRVRATTEVPYGTELTDRRVYLDNIQTAIGNPTYRIIPPGNASVKEVLLQYDSEGHKVYFATAEGVGAIDVDVHGLDYFTPLTEFAEDPLTENLSADFARVDNEA